MRRFACYLIGLICFTACAAAPPTQPFATTAVPATPEAVASSDAVGGYPAPTSAPADAYPAPGTSAPASGYPAPGSSSTASVDGRSRSALTSYPQALQVATTEFDPQARLFAVAPSQIMIGNLGGPPVLPGWFYRFKGANERREFIVHIADSTVTGTTLAESIEEPSPRELPLDIDQITLDSTQAFEQFKTVAASRQLDTDPTGYDFELINLEGKNGPTWSIVDPQTSQWLYSVSATSGQEVPNPHQ